jgi:hypothetical protein
LTLARLRHGSVSGLRHTEMVPQRREDLGRECPQVRIAAGMSEVLEKLNRPLMGLHHLIGVRAIEVSAI